MSASPPDKFRAYRSRKKAAGQRQLRLWVADADNPQFRNALAEQIARINASPEERKVLAASEGAAAEIWKSLD